MIIPKYQNIFLRIGTDFLEEYIIKDFDNNILNLTGHTISASFSNSMLPYDAINSPMVHVVPITAQIVDPLLGKISISLTGTETSALKFGRYLYQINITTPGKVYRAYEGILTINP